MITPPRVAAVSEMETNKAFIELARLFQEALDALSGKTAGSLAALDAKIAALDVRVVKLEANALELIRGIKIGGGLSYNGAANQHLLQPFTVGVQYAGVPYLVSLQAWTILTNALANYPASGAWAYVTINYQGVLQLRAATGNLTARPTDNFFQLSDGAVGYDDIGRAGYYYADGERIIGTLGRISVTSFIYITCGTETNEEGRCQARIFGGTTAGAPLAYSGIREIDWSTQNGRVSFSMRFQTTGVGTMTGTVLFGLPRPVGPGGSWGAAFGYCAGHAPGAGLIPHLIIGSSGLSCYAYNPQTGTETQQGVANFAAVTIVISGFYSIR